MLCFSHLISVLFNLWSVWILLKSASIHPYLRFYFLTIHVSVICVYKLGLDLVQFSASGLATHSASAVSDCCIKVIVSNVASDRWAYQYGYHGYHTSELWYGKWNEAFISPWVLSDWNHLCLSYTERAVITRDTVGILEPLHLDKLNFILNKGVCLGFQSTWRPVGENVVSWVIGSATSLWFSPFPCSSLHLKICQGWEPSACTI